MDEMNCISQKNVLDNGMKTEKILFIANEIFILLNNSIRDWNAKCERRKTKDENAFCFR